LVTFGTKSTWANLIADSFSRETLNTLIIISFVDHIKFNKFFSETDQILGRGIPPKLAVPQRTSFSSSSYKVTECAQQDLVQVNGDKALQLQQMVK